MKLWKQALLASYYFGSQPYRRRQNRRAAASGLAPLVVLTFHRVSDQYTNGWTTRPAEFVRQIDWLRKRYELISLEEVQERVRRGWNTRTAVAITFDDGYAENCQLALPLLIRWKIPCTYFVCTDSVLHGKHFGHDTALGLHCPPNTVEQLQAVARAGISIGAHTRTHSDLRRVCDRERLRDEVVVAGEELQTAIGTPVRYFAFPFGQHNNLNAEAFQLAYEAGYDGVCSAYGGYNLPGDDPFHLQRFCVDGPLIRTQNIVSGDPLKQWSTRRFFYGPELSSRRPVGAAP